MPEPSHNSLVRQSILEITDPQHLSPGGWWTWNDIVVHNITNDATRAAVTIVSKYGDLLLGNVSHLRFADSGQLAAFGRIIASGELLGVQLLHTNIFRDLFIMTDTPVPTGFHEPPPRALATRSIGGYRRSLAAGRRAAATLGKLQNLLGIEGDPLNAVVSHEMVAYPFVKGINRNNQYTRWLYELVSPSEDTRMHRGPSLPVDSSAVYRNARYILANLSSRNSREPWYDGYGLDAEGMGNSLCIGSNTVAAEYVEEVTQEVLAANTYTDFHNIGLSCGCHQCDCLGCCPTSMEVRESVIDCEDVTDEEDNAPMPEIFLGSMRYTRKLPPNKVGASGSKVFPYYMGLELEVSNLKENTQSEVNRKLLDKVGISCVKDGSLDRDLGREYVSPPMRGAAVLPIVKTLTSVLYNHSAECGKDAGIHVHVDASSMLHIDLIKLAILWIGIEKEVMSTVPEHRRTNSRYCRQLSDQLVECNDWARPLAPNYGARVSRRLATRALFEILSNSKRDNFPYVMSDLGIDDRYYALNFEALRKHGTVEFRIMESTLDSERIIRMMRLFSNIVATARNTPVSCILEGVSQNTATELLGKTAQNTLALYRDFGGA